MGAGVNYSITGFDPDSGEPIFEQTGPGKGIGGFATIFGTDYHTIGNSGARGEVGTSPEGSGGNYTEEKGCDGTGIDYAEWC